MTEFIRTIIYIAAFIFGSGMYALACVPDMYAVNRAEGGAGTGTLLRCSPKYILIAVFGGVIAVLCIYFLSASPGTLTKFIFTAVLMAVAVTDFDTMEIPNWLCLAAAAVGLVSIFTLPGLTILSRVIGVFCVSVPLILITLAVPGAFGGGDIKLMAACGIMLGWKNSLLAAFIAVILGGIWGAILLITKKKKGSEHFAFGPFLCFGVAVCTFFGEWVAKAFVYIFDFSRFF